MKIKNYSDSEFIFTFLNDLPNILLFVENEIINKDFMSRIDIQSLIRQKRKALTGFTKIKRVEGGFTSLKKKSLQNSLRLTGFIEKAAKHILDKIYVLMDRIRSGRYTRETLRELLYLINLVLGTLIHLGDLSQINQALLDIKDYKDIMLDSL